MTKKIKDKEEIKKAVREYDLYQLLLKKAVDLTELSKKFKVSEKDILEHILSLKSFKFNVDLTDDNKYFIEKSYPINFKHSFNKDMWKGDTIKFGFTSDNHLGNNAERLDVLNLLYDIFADEGIDTVYNAGNIIDGEARFNKNELHTHGMTKQVEYFASHYPHRVGITTKFIAGDDHEGWYAQREGINIGEYMLMKRIQAGLNDMEYLGYVEADIELTENGFENKSWLRIAHPGGGTAYALSYTAQKIVESYQGGEKPAVLLLGHFHKLDYSFPREVHCIQTGCTEDQTIFMRKKRIQAMVGGGICTIKRAKDGTINRCQVEFITAFDKKFYLGNTKYWK